MTHRGMKFGIFLAPFHRIGENPTLALARDMELIEWMDHLGYDEVWVGEHHSPSTGPQPRARALTVRGGLGVDLRGRRPWRTASHRRFPARV